MHIPDEAVAMLPDMSAYPGAERVGESGQGLAEYALILSLIAIVAIAALTVLGGQISGLLGDVGSAL